ncbi:hypothetical protein QLH51_04830 [Sphingomonas sp. 2R-10]|uniref:hypothetical protein n=1 Tax=Sphingomonas sp. 2R-10 TaxID=3045148 RepID=UPI000F779158|nr:hypothetical protein [Sphingomonas sp. 2R-10]MDJ0276129.1 hypothetical protein [Sphingomonas sp. 2R-10]
MSEPLVFRTGWPKRLLSWFAILGGSAALLAIIDAMARHWATLPATEIWSGMAIGLFVLCFVVAGFGIQDFHWRIEGDTIRVTQFYRTKTIDLATVAGYGTTVVVVGAFPLTHVDLYDGRLKPIDRLPINAGDLPRAEAWLSRLLRPVVDDGSAAVPRRRFADEED